MNLTQLQKRIDKEIPKIAKKLAENSEQMLLVGGALRDIVFGKKPADFDFVISDIEKARSFFSREKIKFFTIEKKDFIFLRVVLKGRTLDFIKQDKPLVADIRERDFTINTIFYNVKTKDLIGSHEAFEDIENRILRVASPDSIEKDPLRALRGIRFAANFGLKIEKLTKEKMRSGFALLKNVPSDRKHDELRKLFSANFESLVKVFCEILSEKKDCVPKEVVLSVKRCKESHSCKTEISKGISLAHLCKLSAISETFRLDEEDVFGVTKKEKEFLDVLKNTKCEFEYFFEVFERHNAEFAVCANVFRCNGEKADKIAKWEKVKIDGNKLKEETGISGRELGKLKREKTKEMCKKIYEEV